MLGCGALLPKTEDPKPPALDAAGVGPKLKVLPVAALLLAPNRLGVEVGAPKTELAPGVPKAGALVPGVPKGLGLLAPKTDGLLLAPNAVVDDAAPNASVELAPNREVPVAGVPKAGVLLAPNAAGALVADPNGFDVAAAPKLKEPPEDVPKGCRHRNTPQAQQAGSGREQASRFRCSQQCFRSWACGCLMTEVWACRWSQAPFKSL